MHTTIPASDVSLVLETNNLASSDEHATIASMERLLVHLRAQTLPLAELREVVITHDGISDAGQARLHAAAERPLAFVRLRDGTGYYDAKNEGFDETSAPIVAFGDADCWPDADWLRRLVAPLCEGWSVAAGRTTYRDGSLGRALTSIDFMYFRDTAGTATRNFYANNVAFARDVFAEHRYRPAPMYRGACQLLGMRLQQAGVAVCYVDEAHTVHRLPDSVRELVELRLRRGRDLRVLSPHVVEAAAPIVAPRLPAERRLAGAVIAGRWVCSLRHVRRHAPSLRGSVAEIAIMTGVTAVDAVGVFRRRRSAEEGALSYHGDVDGLT